MSKKRISLFSQEPPLTSQMASEMLRLLGTVEKSPVSRCSCRGKPGSCWRWEMLPQAAHGSESSLDSSVTARRAPGSVCLRGLREEIRGFGLGDGDGWDL